MRRILSGMRHLLLRSSFLQQIKPSGHKRKNLKNTSTVYKIALQLLFNQIIIIPQPQSQKMLQLKCEQKFSMGSTYSYSKQIEKTLLESIPGWIKSRCPILKIIRSVCNMVRVNPLECCLLGWLLAKSKYDIERISTDSRTKLVEDEFDQKVLVYVLMNAYYVKTYVCEQVGPQIDTDIVKQIPNFKHLYGKKFNPEKSLKTLSLGDVNKMFNEWTCRQDKRTKMDYNNLVDKILYLSKSYNVTSHDENKSQKLGAPRKRRKPNQQSQADEDNYNENEVKSDLSNNNNEQKSQSMHNYDAKNKPSGGSFKFTHSPEAPDFLGPSQQNMHSFGRQNHDNVDMNQSKRTTRNMLQSINIYDFMASPDKQDNLFHSQFSSISGGANLIGSQHSALHGEQMEMLTSSIVRRTRNKGTKSTRTAGMGLKRTDSFDQIH